MIFVCTYFPVNTISHLHTLCYIWFVYLQVLKFAQVFGTVARKVLICEKKKKKKKRKKFYLNWFYFFTSLVRFVFYLFFLLTIFVSFYFYLFLLYCQKKKSQLCFRFLVLFLFFILFQVLQNFISRSSAPTQGAPPAEVQ